MVNWNKPKFKILALMLMLFILPFISSAEPDYIAPYRQNYTIVAAVDVNGIPIDPGVGTCNITLRNTYGNYIELETNMSINAAGDASISINSSALQELGDYPGKICCVQGGLNETKSFILKTTSSGEDRGYGFFLILIISGFVVLILAVKMDNFYGGFLAGLLIMMGGVYSMIYGIGNIADIYSRVIAISLLGIGITINISAGLEAIEILKIRFS